MKLSHLVPVSVLMAAGVGVLGFWWNLDQPLPEPRVPIEREAVAAESTRPLNPGTLIQGNASASSLPGGWSQFRGEARDNQVHERRLAAWSGDAPRELWNVVVGEGHAGPAIRDGRVYLVDYDSEAEESAIRCLSLDDGGEIWRYTFSEPIKRNHGMTRTVPAIAGDWLVAMTPKCRVLCLNATSGELNWEIDLVAECGTVVPPWYAGQCPLIVGEQVILAPGAEPLMMAIDLATGERVWETAGHGNMGMTHSSIVPVTLGGVDQFVYCAGRGVVGVSAESGEVLWTHPDWKIGIANIPSPLPVGEDRLFFTGGYDSGSQMVQVSHEGEDWRIEELFRLETAEFGSDQQTPVLHDDHILGVSGGRLKSIRLTGEIAWESAVEDRYGLGPQILIGDLLYVLHDQKGILDCYRFGQGRGVKLSGAEVMQGHDAWGPMAYVPGRLLIRDLTQLICLEI